MARCRVQRSIAIVLRLSILGLHSACHLLGDCSQQVDDEERLHICLQVRLNALARDTQPTSMPAYHTAQLPLHPSAT